MSSSHETDTDELLNQVQSRKEGAIDELFARHRQRLRHMVNVRMDRRLASRIDPSDVVQEALIDATRRLDDYLEQRPMPFYPWIRNVTWNRLLDLHRLHLKTAKRSVAREAKEIALTDESADLLARNAVSRQTSAIHYVMRDELRARVQVALDELSEDHREVLLMRHVERMSVDEIAALTGLAAGTVKSRAFRALRSLQKQLSDEARGSQHD